LRFSNFDTVALKFGLDPFPTQVDPMIKNMKSIFRNHAHILIYMEITIIGVSEAYFLAFLGSFHNMGFIGSACFFEIPLSLWQRSQDFAKS